MSRKERPIGDAAAQKHVLSVVHPQAVAIERIGGAAEPGPRLEQGDGGAFGGAAKRGGDSGETATDHGHRARSHTAAPPIALEVERAAARLCSATHAFCQVVSEIRPTST